MLPESIPSVQSFFSCLHGAEHHAQKPPLVCMVKMHLRRCFFLAIPRLPWSLPANTQDCSQHRTKQTTWSCHIRQPLPHTCTLLLRLLPSHPVFVVAGLYAYCWPWGCCGTEFISKEEVQNESIWFHCGHFVCSQEQTCGDGRRYIGLCFSWLQTNMWHVAHGMAWW